MQTSIKKYILVPVLGILTAGSFTSCKKFLQERQVSTLTQTYYETETGLTALINGLYVISRVKHEWDANGSKLIEPETDAYMHVNLNFARVTVPAYGNNTSTIATQNMTNFIGAANSNYAPMGTYPHINNCNIALDLIDNVKPGKFGSDETFRKTRRSE